MDIVPRRNSNIARQGASVLRNNAFYREFLDLFGTENMQSFLKQQVRCDAEWQSLHFFVKLSAYISEALGYLPDKETTAYYLNAIMKNAQMRRIAHKAVRKKPRKRNKALCDVPRWKEIAFSVVDTNVAGGLGDSTK